MKYERKHMMLIGAAAGLLGAAPVGLAQSPDELILSGQIWDFQGSHPDFGLSTSSGHEVSGLLSYYLAGGAPVFDGSGLIHTQDTLDASGNEIAPHLFADSAENTGVYRVLSQGTVDNSAVQDSYPMDSGYDVTTAQPLPNIDLADSIPPLVAPSMSVSKTPEMKYKKTGGYTTDTIVSGDYHTDSFSISNGFQLVIDGDVVIRADSEVSITQGSELVITDGSTLTLWIGGTFEFRNSAVANLGFAVNTNQWDHTRLILNNFGTDPMVFDNNTDFQGTIVSPTAEVQLSNSTHFYGAMTAQSVDQDNSSGLHIAGEFSFIGNCFSGGDIQQATGSSNAGRITSPLSFLQWFRDVPGVNLPDTEQLIMTKVGSTYRFNETDWRPIDGELYNSSVSGPNRNFTVSLQSIFFNANCGGSYMEIETSMDAWVFIDDTLVIDLGGSTGTNRQRIDLDRLGLASDQWYRLRVLIAARVDGPQPLRIDTTIPLTAPRNYLVRADPAHD